MPTKRWLQILLCVLAILCAPAADAQDKLPEYLLGPGDNIRILVFQSPDLTMETRVTENGTVSYPLLGSVHIGGMTIPAAEQVIAKGLKAGDYVREPQVNIVLLRNSGSQVSVLGAVNRAGRFPLETFNTRVSEMIAIAGGIAPAGADVVIVTGTRAGKMMRKEVNISAMFLENKLEDDIVVAAGDVLYVHRQPVFYIYGEVQRPGSYRIERGMTLRQALAQGGGPTLRGTERALRVYRRGAADKKEYATPELGDAVNPDDVLYVQGSLF